MFDIGSRQKMTDRRTWIVNSLQLNVSYVRAGLSALLSFLLLSVLAVFDVDEFSLNFASHHHHIPITTVHGTSLARNIIFCTQDGDSLIFIKTTSCRRPVHGLVPTE